MNPHRNFLEAAIAVGLETGIVTPAQIMEHLDAELLAKHLPTESIAALLMAGMSADAMNAKLIVDTLGPSVLCEYLPVHLLWGCVADAAQRTLANESAPTPSNPPPKAGPDESALGKAKATMAVAKTAASSAAAALAGATSKSVLRRPNASRRPERLTNQTPTPTPTATPAPAPAPAPRPPGSEFDVDTSVGGWPDPDKTREARALGPSPLDDWNEETVTGAEAVSPRKR